MENLSTLRNEHEVGQLLSDVDFVFKTSLLYFKCQLLVALEAGFVVFDLGWIRQRKHHLGNPL